MSTDPVGKWDAHHGALVQPFRYGADETYRLAAEWVAGCNPVEDWGCGGGGLRSYIDPRHYVGIDGSDSPFADRVADLTRYHTRAEGIVIRHVLEHNHGWRAVLANALDSFTRRLCIVLFTPLVEETIVLATEPEYGDVPVIAFHLDDVLEEIEAFGVPTVEWDTLGPLVGAHYGSETIVRAAW